MLVGIKEASGLGWNKIAQILGVSRQAIYDWIEGKSITPEHHLMIMNLSEVFQKLPPKNALSIRTFILCGQFEGIPMLDVLKRGECELFIQVYKNKDGRFQSFTQEQRAFGLDNLAIEDRMSLREDGPTPEQSVTRIGKASRRE
jgi:DNA-binding XRE family transcriptional regulator